MKQSCFINSDLNWGLHGLKNKGPAMDLGVENRWMIIKDHKQSHFLPCKCNEKGKRKTGKSIHRFYELMVSSNCWLIWTHKIDLFYTSSTRWCSWFRVEGKTFCPLCSTFYSHIFFSCFTEYFSRSYFKSKLAAESRGSACALQLLYPHPDAAVCVWMGQPNAQTLFGSWGSALPACSGSAVEFMD